MTDMKFQTRFSKKNKFHYLDIADFVILPVLSLFSISKFDSEITDL